MASGLHETVSGTDSFTQGIGFGALSGSLQVRLGHTIRGRIVCHDPKGRTRIEECRSLQEWLTVCVVSIPSADPVIGNEIEGVTRHTGYVCGDVEHANCAPYSSSLKEYL